jgi:hypothetical protein
MIATVPQRIPAHQNVLRVSFATRSIRAIIGSSAVRIRRSWSRKRLRHIFTPAELRTPHIGCRLSLKTANANSQSSESGFIWRSFRYAAFASAQSRSRVMFRGTSSGGPSSGAAQPRLTFEGGKILRSECSSSLSRWPDSFACSSMRRTTKVRAVSKSVVRSIGTSLLQNTTFQIAAKNNTASGQVLLNAEIGKVESRKNTCPVCRLTRQVKSIPVRTSVFCVLSSH